MVQTPQEVQNAGRQPAVRTWLDTACALLADHREKLNAINVFPVPDGDTGSNMLATLTAASEAIRTQCTTPNDVGACLSVGAQAALENARGNSGTLLAVILSALAESLAGVPRLTSAGLARGLHRCTVKAWAALSEPVPGTMLSVLETTAETLEPYASSSNESTQELTEALNTLVSCAQQAVVHTTEQLSALSKAQVVDSGAVGLLLVCEALRSAITRTPVNEELCAALPGYHAQHQHTTPAELSPYGVEVMCSIDLSALDAATLRYELDRRGDSVIISAVNALDEENHNYRWRVHVHVADAEDALSALHAVGTPENISISTLNSDDHECC